MLENLTEKGRAFAAAAVIAAVSGGQALATDPCTGPLTFTPTQTQCKIQVPRFHYEQQTIMVPRVEYVPKTVNVRKMHWEEQMTTHHGCKVTFDPCQSQILNGIKCLAGSIMGAVTNACQPPAPVHYQHCAPAYECAPPTCAPAHTPTEVPSACDPNSSLYRGTDPCGK